MKNLHPSTHENSAECHSGFTLVELVVAFGLFTLFLSGLFALYRAGSNMFLTGSWKLNKQKEAERFLALLKSRLEQASNLTWIDPDRPSSQQVGTAIAPIYMMDNLTVTPSAAPLKLLLFTVSKPDLSHPKIAGSQGLRLAHAIWLVPQTVGFGELQLFASNLACASLTSPQNFPPDASSLGGDFSAPPSAFQLGPNEFQATLGDVESVGVTWGTASGTRISDAGKTIGLVVNLRNPKHRDTSFSQTVQSRIAPDLQIHAFKNLGEF